MLPFMYCMMLRRNTCIQTSETQGPLFALHFEATLCQKGIQAGQQKGPEILPVSVNMQCTFFVLVTVLDTDQTELT